MTVTTQTFLNSYWCAIQRNNSTTQLKLTLLAHIHLIKVPLSHKLCIYLFRLHPVFIL